jgi:predicted dehydrogenase
MTDPRLSRRDLVRGAAGGLLAATASSLASASPDAEPVRVAVVGTGARGCDLVRALTTIPSCALVAICDDYAPHLDQGVRYAGPGTKTYDNYHHMLNDSHPDAVVIAVPLMLHHEVAVAALNAGCAVFCEKTMCPTLDQSNDLVRRVEESGAVFQVGLQRRANLIYQQAASLVKTGALGTISAIKAQWHRHHSWRRPVPVPKSDPRWTELEHRLNWRLRKATSGGLMAELGSHQVDVASWLLGHAPKRVIATGGIDHWRDGRDVADNVFATLEFDGPDGTTVRMAWSSLCDNAYEGASELVLGTRGTLFLTPTKGLFFREAVADDPRSGPAMLGAVALTAGKTLKMASSPWAHRGEPVEIDNVQGDDTRDQLISFVDHVRRRDTVTLCDARAGHANTLAVVLVNEAIESGEAAVRPPNFDLTPA